MVNQSFDIQPTVRNRPSLRGGQVALGSPQTAGPKPFGSGLGQANQLQQNKPASIPVLSAPIQQEPQVALPIDDNKKKLVGELGATFKQGSSIQDIKELFPELQGLDDDTIGELGATFKQGSSIDEVYELFPELHDLTTQGSRFGAIQDDKNILGIPKIPRFNDMEDKSVKEGATKGQVLGQFAENAAKSTLNLASDVTNFVLDPIDSAKGIANIAGGLGVNAYEGLTGKEVGGRGKVMGDTASMAGKYFKDRYGSMENFSKSAYEDPVGVFSDIVSLVGGGASVASKLSRVSGLTKTADTLSDISRVASYDPANVVLGAEKEMAKGAYNLGKKGVGIAKDKALQGLGSLGEKVAEVSPDGLKGVGNTVAKKLLGSKLKLTDTNKRAIEKASGMDATEFALENDIVGKDINSMVEKTKDLVSESFKEKFTALDSDKSLYNISKRDELIANSITRNAKLDLQEVYGMPFDEIKNVIPEVEEVFAIINKIDNLVASGKMTISQKEALKSLFDMYNSHLKYDPTKKRTLSSMEKIRLGLQGEIEDVGSKVGVDINAINKKIAGGKAMEKALIQAGNRMDNNNMFGLSDTQTAILSAVLGGGAAEVAGVVIGKSLLDRLGTRSTLAKGLYTKGLTKKNANTPVITPKRTTASDNISRSLGNSSSTRTTANKPTKGLKAEIKPKPSLGTDKSKGLKYKTDPEFSKGLKPRTETTNNPLQVRGLPKVTEDLATEAKKYKSADEFVKNNVFYRGETGDGGNYFTRNKNFANEFADGKPLTEIGLDEKDIYRPSTLPEAVNEKQVTKAIKDANLNGYKAVYVDEGTGFGEPVESVFVFDKSSIKTKDQLRKIREEANPSKGLPKTENSLITEAKKYKSADEFFDALSELPQSTQGSFPSYKYEITKPSENVLDVLSANYYGGEVSAINRKLVSIDDLSIVDSLENQKGRISKLSEEIKNSGKVSPIIADSDGNVIEGRHRVQAMKQLGESEIPAIVFEKVPDSINTKDSVKKIREEANK